jgi:hypothetical protein
LYVVWLAARSFGSISIELDQFNTLSQHETVALVDNENMEHAAQ